jgi:hypothetical protein
MYDKCCVFVVSVMAQGSYLLSLWPAVADKRLGPAPSPGTRPHADTDPVLCECPVLYLSLTNRMLSKPSMCSRTSLVASFPLCDSILVEIKCINVYRNLQKTRQIKS